MAIDKRLQIYDEQGNLVDYDILASDVKFLPDGKDLPTKLAELEDEIGEGGYAPPQDGIPKTDLAPSVQASLGLADTAYQKPASGIPASDIADGVIPDTSNLATKTELAGKVDKNGTDSLMTAAEHTKLAGVAAGAQVNVINSISVNNTPATPVNGNVNISVQGAAGEDGITPHIGSNGNWWIGPETDQNNDTGIKAQGPAGSVTITDGDIDTLEVHNALNAYTGLLGMSGAMRIKSNIDSLYASLNRLYGKLGNIAFWSAQDKADAAPTALDWQVPKKALTITNNLSNSVVSYNGEPVSGSILVDAGETIDLLVSGASGYVVTSVSASGATVIDNENGTFTVRVKVDDDISLTISGTAVEVNIISLVAKDEGGATLTGALSISKSTVADGSNFEALISIDDTYFDGITIASVKDANDNDVTYSFSSGTISISNVQSNITITAIATKVVKVWFGKSLNMFGAMVDASGECVSDYIRITGLSDDSNAVWYSGLSSGQGMNSRCLLLYDKNKKHIYFDGSYEVVRCTSHLTNKSNNHRDVAASWLESVFSAAGNNTPLYMRVTSKCSGTTINSSVGFTQNNVNFISMLSDPTKYQSTSEAVTQHTLSYTLNHVTVDNNGAPTAFPDGQPLEVAFLASSGYSISNATIAVTMGSDTLVEGTGYTVVDKIVKNTIYTQNTSVKVVRIESVTGNVNFNVSIS